MKPTPALQDQVSAQVSAGGPRDRTKEVHAARRKIVMVGNGMVGHRFCIEWIKSKTSATDELVIIGEETVPAYDRIHLTNGLSGAGAESLELAAVGWYEEHRIALHLGDPVARIEREQHQVKTRSGARFDYDVLILATGSSARRLPVPGADLPGVFVYRTLADLTAIKERASRAQVAAVLGGGLLGLEAARALQDLGLRTHVIETAKGLMTRQLNEEAAGLLEQRVRATGIQVLTDCLTDSITSTGDSLRLNFRDGRTLMTDMVVMAAGVDPRDELASACGLKTGARGGVLVDETLRTSDGDIYAIGECALPKGTFYGFAAPGFDMARVLAARLNGRNERFENIEYPVRLKLLGTDVITIGDIRGEGTLLTHRSRGVLKQILLTKGKVSGVSLLGSAEDVGRMQTAVLKQQRLRDGQQKRFLVTGSPWKSAGDDVSLWPAASAICQCTGVTRGQLSCALAEGCATVEALSERTGAGSVCGSCRPLLANLCGASSTSAVRFARPLLWTCVAVAVLVAVTLVIGPLPVAQSVQDLRLDALWFDGTLKQITGYTLLAVMLLGFLLPMRKHIAALAKWGDFSFWRILHTGVGVAALVMLTAHTGFRLGFNLNKVLMLNVLTLALTGALAGGVIALSHRLSPAGGRLLQTGWTVLHTVLCWPLLVLVLFHILTVYRY